MEELRVYGPTRERMSIEPEGKANLLKEFKQWKLGAQREYDIDLGVALALTAADNDEEVDEKDMMLAGLGKLLDRAVTMGREGIDYAEKMAERLQNDAAAAPAE